MIVDCDTLRGFPGGSVVKKLLANAGDAGESIPGSGRSPEGRHGNPLQYSCLEKPMDRGAWQAAVHGVEKSRTRLKLLSMHTHKVRTDDPTMVTAGLRL